MLGSEVVMKIVNDSRIVDEVCLIDGEMLYRLMLPLLSPPFLRLCFNCVRMVCVCCAHCASMYVKQGVSRRI